MYLNPEDIVSHLSTENIDIIVDGNATILTEAISAAISEATGYLHRYDLEQILNAEVKNPILLLYVKDLAVWHFIQLANPNIEMSLRERRYELAIKWFEKVQNGKIVPDLPLKVTDQNIPLTDVRFGSSRKQQNGFL